MDCCEESASLSREQSREDNRLGLSKEGVGANRLGRGQGSGSWSSQDDDGRTREENQKGNSESSRNPDNGPSSRDSRSPSDPLCISSPLADIRLTD